jgi:CysZ protein
LYRVLNVTNSQEEIRTGTGNSMIISALRAARDVLSPQFRSILWKAIGLTLLLFTLLLIGVVFGTSMLLVLPWPWLETITATLAGLGFFVGFFFLMGPVTALFAGFFLDTVAEIVEKTHYPGKAVGKPPAALSSALMGLQFGLVVLVLNILTLPTLFLGVGAIIMLVTNAYLLGREYFTMVAVRHKKVRQATMMRKANSMRIWAAGFIPAALALIPFVNILVPLFSTSYFVHIYNIVDRDEQDMAAAG